jgi:hypothetical protein
MRRMARHPDGARAPLPYLAEQKRVYCFDNAFLARASSIRGA